LFVVKRPVRARQELSVFGVVECVELLGGASQLDVTRHNVGEVDRDKMARAWPVFGFDDEVGQSAGDRVDHDPLQLAAIAVAVAASDLRADHEVRGVSHRCSSAVCCLRAFDLVDDRCCLLPWFAMSIGGGRAESPSCGGKGPCRSPDY
jgi:hypothetical protein